MLRKVGLLKRHNVSYWIDLPKRNYPNYRKARLIRNRKQETEQFQKGRKNIKSLKLVNSVEVAYFLVINNMQCVISKQPMRHRLATAALKPETDCI